jgi:hypothetical protein
MNIKIRTGNGLRARLATTVTFENLFTELVKNSLQNNATRVEITYNNAQVRVVDNGVGFDHVADDSGLNEFEKYFVFGSSYTKQDKRLNLGEMGVGGKAANDKLSDISNTHWTIHTINKHGKAFEMAFKSTDEKYLDQVQPQLREIDRGQAQINFPTGTRVTIHNVNPEIIQSGWPHEDIEKNLQLFFNMLYYQTKSQNNTFELFVNGKQIKFNRELPGDRFLQGTRVFTYNIAGQNRQATYEYQLNHLHKRSGKHLLKFVDLVSYTRIREIRLNPAYIDTSKYEHFDSNMVCDYWNKQIRGYILCPALSDVKDNNGMSAKDLTHHNLNPNHPVTVAFYKDLHEFISEPLCRRINDMTNPDKFAEKTMNHVARTIASRFNIPDNFVTEK